MDAPIIRCLILLHLFGAIVWAGGMFFVHFVLRPAVGETLEPPQRLQLLESVMRRFFRIVGVSATAVLISGFALLGREHNGALGLHIMAGLGLVMTLVFLQVQFVLFPGFQASLAASDMASAGAMLGRIRARIALNLSLAALAIAAATLLRA